MAFWESPIDPSRKVLQIKVLTVFSIHGNVVTLNGFFLLYIALFVLIFGHIQ